MSLDVPKITSSIRKVDFSSLTKVDFSNAQKIDLGTLKTTYPNPAVKKVDFLYAIKTLIGKLRK